jgi:hypothetical protein
MMMMVHEGGIATRVNIGRFSIYDIKRTITHIAVTQASLIRALSSPQCLEESVGDSELPIFIVTEDEDGDLSYAILEDFSPLSEGTIRSAIAALESQRTEFLLMLFHIGLSRGSESVLGMGDEGDDDDPGV